MSVKSTITPKDVAVFVLWELNVSPRYILDFQTNDCVYLFNPGKTPERIAPNSELADKIREIEEERKLKIYAVTHDYLPIIGETYSFLCISPYEEDWDGMLQPIRNNAGFFRAYAYVHNVANPECSESGYVVLFPHLGKLVRVG